MDEAVKQVILVEMAAQDDGQASERMALFNSDGTPFLDTLGSGVVASDVDYDNAGSGLTAVETQSAIDEIAASFTTHVTDAGLKHDASGVVFAPAGGVAAVNVQAAIEEVAADALAGPAPVTTATAAATAAKTTASAEPAANAIVPIIFTDGNTAAAPTVAFNGGAARPVLLGGAAPADTEITVAATGVALFWFDGTSLHQFGAVS